MKDLVWHYPVAVDFTLIQIWRRTRTMDGQPAVWSIERITRTVEGTGTISTPSATGRGIIMEYDGRTWLHNGISGGRKKEVSNYNYYTW